MPGSIRDAIGSAVRKAKAKKDTYVQAAKDLARAPGQMKDVVALKTPIEGFEKAKKLQAASRRARGGYGR